MPLEARLLTGLAVALAVAYWATPLAIRVADRLEFYDQPAGYKGHGHPTPYLGGAAVMVGFLIAAVLLTGDWGKTLPLVGGVAVLWALGTVDDRRNVSPGLRIGVEVMLAVLLYGLGLGWDLGAGGAVDLTVTAIWVVAVVNAFNLFDNMDGAATSMAGVVAAALSVLGIVQGDSWLAVTAAALAGACIGFLPHNLFSSPAKIFLGDGGSMPIGFAVAALAMIGVADAAPAWQSLAMGVLLVGVPTLDTALVVISRTRRGVSILTGGRDHLTHRTHRRMRTARAVALTLGATQAVVSVLAIAALQGGSAPIVAVVVLYAVAAGVAIAVLDTRMAPDAPSATPAATAPGSAPAHRRLRIEVLAPTLLVPFGLAAGVSPLFHGYYSSGLWVPGGLILVPAATALAVARPVKLSRPGWLLLGSLAGLALLSLASAGWADSIQQAVVEGNRLLVYTVSVGLLLLLLRDERAALWALGALAAAALVVAAVTVVRMLGSAGDDLFLGGRLDQPLGYINGQAAFFLLAAWPCIAVAEQRRSAVLAGAGLGGATLLACFALLSQSRGVAAATLVSIAVVVALVPGRVQRLWGMLLLAAGVALAGPALLDIYQEGVAGRLSASTVRDGALAAVAAAIGVGIAWGGLRAAAERVPSRTGSRLAAGTLALVLAGGLFVAAVNAGSIRNSVSDQYNAFVHLSVEQSSAIADGSTSRLVSGAGNRYDYWRVAWQAFKERPVGGVGAGNYDRPYFAGRTTGEDIRQPHSIELQVLSELGIVGALLLAALLAAAGWGAWRTARAARSSPGASFVAVAAIGILAAWLTQTSVDWLHLLPGVTAAALVAAAVLVRRSEPVIDVAAAPRHGLRARVPVAVAVALVLAVAGLSLTREGLSERYRHLGQQTLQADPGRALVQADRALRLDAEDVPAYYLKAAALARFNRPIEARGALEEAARREPGDFVTWALLGDLAVRSGDLAAAQRDYARASALNPRDVTLRTLAADPASASAGAR